MHLSRQILVLVLKDADGHNAKFLISAFVKISVKNREQKSTIL
jgi:hypothetical protein